MEEDISTRTSSAVDERVLGEGVVEPDEPLLELGRRHVPAVPAVAEAGHATQRGLALAADVDGRAGGLDRLGEAERLVEVHVAAVEGALVLCPQRMQRPEVLIRDAPSFVERHIERRELFREPAEADAEVEPPAREVVDRVDLSGPQRRVPQWEQGDGGTDPQRCGVHGHGLARHHGVVEASLAADRETRTFGRTGLGRVRVNRVVLLEEHDVLRSPDGVEAERLGRLREVAHVCRAVLGRAAEGLDEADLDGFRGRRSCHQMSAFRRTDSAESRYSSARVTRPSSSMVMSMAACMAMRSPSAAVARRTICPTAPSVVASTWLMS